MKEKPGLLLLCHRIPYPPNKGDKIRAFHLLRYLSEHYRVYLGAFVDDPEDWQYQQTLANYCQECLLVPLHPHLAKLRSLQGFITGQALTLPYYRNHRLSRWVRAVVELSDITLAVGVSAAVGPYIEQVQPQLERCVLDLVDIDSDKWCQYARHKRWPMSWVYQREGERLLAYERHAAATFAACLFVSSAEARLFRRYASAHADKISYYNNGVDSAFFAPEHPFANPYAAADSPVIVFTGAMDYWPNVDAVCWFSRQILPQIRQQFGAVRFYIVGGKPTDEVQKLAELEGITVTGRVDDVRPYIAWSAVSVAPMRVARGVQNKVLEAMAMAKPVVVTPMGLEGIEALDGEQVRVAEDEQHFAQVVTELLQGQQPQLGAAARRLVQNAFSWQQSLPRVGAILAGQPIPGLNEG